MTKEKSKEFTCQYCRDKAIGLITIPPDIKIHVCGKERCLNKSAKVWNSYQEPNYANK